MGNSSSSLPEQLYAAVHKNNLGKFQELTSNYGPLAASDPISRAKVLEFKDAKGRTPLVVAAAKNHYQMLQQLIPLGADIHYVNPSPASLGGALHEAASRGHEGVVELLLASGANPFVANSQGHTAMDEAVLSNHIGIVRRMEEHAAYRGDVEVKIKSMGGLSAKFKERWVVVMPYFNMPRDGKSLGAAGAKRCMWMYKDRGSATPRARVWLDGAVTVRTGPSGVEGMVRLHSSHGEPSGDVSAKFDNGYCIFIRPANLTPHAADKYRELMDLIDSPPSAMLPGTTLRRNPSWNNGNPSSTTSSTGPAAPSPSRNLVSGPAPLMPPSGFTSSGSLPASPYMPNGAGSSLVYGRSGSSSTAPGIGSPYPGIAGAGGNSTSTPTASPYPAPYGQPPRYPSMSPGPAAATAAAAAAASTAMPVTLPPPAASALPPPAPLSAYPSVGPMHQYAPNGSSAPSHQPGAPGPLTGYNPYPTIASPREAGGFNSAGGATAATAAVARLSPSYRTTTSDPGFKAAVAASLATVAQASANGTELEPGFVDTLHALPGESDQEFAARLASAIAATSGRDQTQLYPSIGPALASNNTGSAAASGGGAAAGAGGSTIHANTSVTNSASTSAAGAPPPPAPERSSSRTSRSASPAPRPPLPPQQQQQPLAPVSTAHQAPLIDLDSGDFTPPSATADAAPSAPPAPASFGTAPTTSTVSSLQVSAGGASSSSVDPDNDLCIICLSGPKEVGYLHGDSVHKCVCKACSGQVAVGAPCPLCRRTIERVLGVY